MATIGGLEIVYESSAGIESLESESILKVKNQTKSRKKSPKPDGKKQKRKTPHVYTEEEDLSILKEVAVEKPFKKVNSKEWERIFGRLSIPVKNGNCLKRRFDGMMDAFKKENSDGLRGSGLEEDYSEKKALLQEITDMIADAKHTAETIEDSVRKKTEEEVIQAQKIRKASLETLQNDVDMSDEEESGAKKKKLKKNDYIAILQKQDDREHEDKQYAFKLEERRLELQERELKLKEDNDAHRRTIVERQLALEEKRMELESKKSEGEQEEKRLLFQLLSAQIQSSNAK